MTHSHSEEEERRIRERALDETLIGTFPASDPPSSLPNPDDDSVDAGSATVSVPADDAARITVRRESPDDVGLREVFISIDGEEVAILQPNETFTTRLTPGPHRLSAHNTLFRKTHDLTLRPGEHARFAAINKAGFCQFVCMLLLGASPLYLTFDRDMRLRDRIGHV